MKEPPLPRLQPPHITPTMASSQDRGLISPNLEMKNAVPPQESSSRIIRSKRVDIRRHGYCLTYLWWVFSLYDLC